jgi:hypothetical protein
MEPKARKKRKQKMTELTAVRFPPDMAEEIEQWRAVRRPIPPKGVAIRELVRAGLDAYAGKPVPRAKIKERG